MATNRVWKPFGKDALATTVLAAKEAPHPKLNPHRVAFPGQIRELTLVPAVNSPRRAATSGKAALLTYWSQHHHQPASYVRLQFMQRHFSGIRTNVRLFIGISGEVARS